MSAKKKNDAALGVFVTPSRIEAVLLGASGDGYEVIRRFTRQRMPQSELAGASRLASSLPGLKTSDDADFTLQIGHGNGSQANLFLAGEFVGVGTRVDPGSRGVGSRPAPFVQPLHHILAECAQLGYPNPETAFCITAPDVTYVELFVTRGRTTSSPEKKRLRMPLVRSDRDLDGVDRRHVLDLLKAQHRDAFDEARVVFLPMTPLKGQRRFLAIVPETGESVTTTLDGLLAQHRGLAPATRLLGTELSLYIALARHAVAPAKHENTAIVRIGSEDTLLAFLEGEHLRHLERLRSLTSYEPPETICSRVLLQQDEQKIGELHHVLVLGETRSEQFREAFQKFYPNAAVEPLQRALFEQGVRATDDEDGLRAASVPAIGVALHLLHPRSTDSFASVNVLPPKLRRKPRKPLAFAWHTYLLLLALGFITFFFATRYLEQEAQVKRQRLELQMNPPDPTMGSPAVVRARVDSLRRVYTQYTQALQVLDSLLLGSDQWSRTLEKTSRATNDLSGVWFEQWQPSGTSIRITGNATSRSRVAQLANRLGASIEGTAFEDVNDVRIYPFTIVVPRPIELPKVAAFLRDSLEQASGGSFLPDPEPASLRDR